MSMNKTCAISSLISFLISEDMLTSARASQRVFRSVDHSGADRTLDRAGAMRESAALLKPRCCCTVSKVVSLKRQWRGRVPPCALPPGRGSRSERDPARRLSQWGSRPSPARPGPTRRLYHRETYWSVRDCQGGSDFPAAL